MLANFGSSLIKVTILVATIMQLTMLPVLELHAACSYPNDPDLKEAKSQCDTNSAKQWDCNTNRCLNTEKSIEDRHAYEACVEIEDPKARKQCHDDYAKSKTGDIEAAEDKGGTMASAVMGMAVGLAVINYFGMGADLTPEQAKSKKEKGDCICKSIFTAAAVAGLAGELYTYMFLDKELEKLRERYKKEAVEDNPNQAQLRAFEFLKEEQEAIAKAAKTKATTYKLIAAAYAAAAIAAVWDMTQGRTVCMANQQSTPLIGNSDNYTPIKNESHQYWTPSLALLIPSAYAEESKSDSDKKSDKKKKQKLFAMLIGAGGAAAVAGLAKDSIGQFFNSPTGIVIISGVAAALAFKLASAADKQAKQAKENVEMIQKIIDEFTDNMASFCPGGRGDMETPDCYCYNRDGTQNPNRTNSQTCRNLWASHANQQAIGATDYSKAQSTN